MTNIRQQTTACIVATLAFALSLASATIPVHAQTSESSNEPKPVMATVNLTDVHQIIDGFGAADAFIGPLTTAQQAFLFGPGTGQLGLARLRAARPSRG